MAAFNYQALVQEAQAAGAQTSFEPIPEGEYEAAVKEAKAQQSKKGDPQLVVTFKVEGGPHNGRLQWARMTFVPGNGIGTAINLRQLDALGATPLLENGGTLEQVAAFLTGKRAVIKVGFGKDSFADKNEIKDIKKSSAPVAGSIPMAGGFTQPSPVAPAGPRPF